MNTYRLAETFISINGEGTCAGALAAFLRFPGCNLSCSFCDTRWVNEKDVALKEYTEDELVAFVQSSGVHFVTLTGGEPLLQPHIGELITTLSALGYAVEVETNGSVALNAFASLPFRPLFTMDYKLAGSGMTDKMLPENFALLRDKDAVKFVVGSEDDLDEALAVIRRYALPARCTVFFSPVYGAIEPAQIVAYMKSHRLGDVRLQLQLHKYIWSPNTRGV